tara:strand:- start:541 stop:1146 length:606 start_codon:yes stop_codon:yes gene_type:complete
MMKATLFALFVGLLMLGCGEEGSDAKIDLGEIETVNRIAAESIDRHEILSVAAGGLTQGLKLQKRIKDGEELLYAPNQQTPFTGSAAWYNDNGKLSKVSQFKTGKLYGLSTRWYESGQKKSEENYKDGKRDGLYTVWRENGQKGIEGNWKDGKPLSAVVWKPNGEKCPVTDLKGGNGVVVLYNEDGTEGSRTTYKDGVRVK